MISQTAIEIERLTITLENLSTRTAGLSVSPFRRIREDLYRAERLDELPLQEVNAWWPDLQEDFTRWRDQNTQLNISQDIWMEVRRALSAYRVPAYWSPVCNQIDECTRRCDSDLRGRLLQEATVLNALLEKRQEQERELARFKAQPEPVPPRREATKAARLQIMLRGVFPRRPPPVCGPSPALIPIPKPLFSLTGDSAAA